MNKLQTLCLTILCTTLLFACDHGHDHDHPQKATATSANALPELKDRGTELGPPEEYDKLRDVYAIATDDLQKDPTNNTANLRMAEVFIMEARITGDFNYNQKVALSFLDKILESEKDPSVVFQALSYKATVQLSQHNFEDALVTGQRALAINNKNAGIHGVLVDAYLELGQYNKAIEMADRMVSIRPDLRSYARVSYLREIHGDLDGSIEAMKMAVDAGYPGTEETAWSRVQLAELIAQKGVIYPATAILQITLQNRPNYPPALKALAKLDYIQEDYTAALEKLEKASALVPDAGTYTWLAKVHKAQGEDKIAKEMTNKALSQLGGAMHHHDHGGEHAHTDYHAHGHTHEGGMELANAYLELTNNLDEALTHAKLDYERRPENIDVNTTLASIYYKKGELKMAQNHLDKAMETGSKKSLLHTLEGLIAMETENANTGKTILRSSYKDNPYQIHWFAKEAKTAMDS